MDLLVQRPCARSMSQVAVPKGPGRYGRSSFNGQSLPRFFPYRTELNKPPPDRPRTNKLTLSILRYAKLAEFSALVMKINTFTIDWRPYDLCLFVDDYGNQVGASDPVFMRSF